MLQQNVMCTIKPHWWILLPLLMGVSAGGTSGSSYSITLQSKHCVALHTHTLTTSHYTRTHTQTHTDTYTQKNKIKKTQTPAKSVDFEIHLPPFDSDGNLTKLTLILPVVLAPWPAQAFENMHCHLASFLSLQRVQKIDRHLLLPSLSGSFVQQYTSSCVVVLK